jgi:SAM-dependent methyltransferase
VKAGQPGATFVGDLCDPTVLPDDSFDCIILTQTLHLIYDVRAAVARLRAVLKPGGVLLATVPGISRIDKGEWRESWYWSLTQFSTPRLLEEQFVPEAVTVETHGNVFVAAAFLYGVSLEEMDRHILDAVDPGYPVTITARAVRSSAARGP